MIISAFDSVQLATAAVLHEALQWCSRKTSIPFRHKRHHGCYENFYMTGKKCNSHFLRRSGVETYYRSIAKPLVKRLRVEKRF